MKTENRIKELQEEYFEFCLTLLQKLPDDIDNKVELAATAHQLRDSLNAAIAQHEKDFYGEAVKAVQSEIEELKISFQNKYPDT